MIGQLTGNWLCWAILLLALLCYQQLWLDYLRRRSRAVEPDDRSRPGSGTDFHRESADGLEREFSAVLIGALPLLGLLGTIIGLLDCFAGIASQGASGDLVSGGIANALLTTQLGLVCAVPGWLLQAWVRAPSRAAVPALALER